MEREKKIIRTSIYGIVVNLLLVLFKATVGIISNSIAIILDAVNNLSDSFSSIITIIGTKLSLKKPDREHPFGHGRIEYFSSVIIAMIVMIAGMASFRESFLKILNPEEAHYTKLTLLVVCVAIGVKLVFGKYVKDTGKTLNSQSLVASGTDAFMDAVLSFSTLIAALISIIFGISIEGHIGLLISVIIIKSSYDILKETIGSIIGARPDSELTAQIREKIAAFDEVQGVFDLTLHNYGPSNIIGTAHIQVRDDMTAKEIHILTRNIQTRIYEECNIVMTIGIYAANDQEKYLKIKKTLTEIMKENKDIIQMHGFYVDENTNVITFDLIFDFKCQNSEEIVNNIKNELKEKYPKYDFNIIIDLDLSD